MTFQPERIEDFLLIFDQNKERIRNFDGVEKLELFRDNNQNNILFTYSVWNDLHHLELYRRSELFKNVWTETRKMFLEKAEAWSLDKLISL
jgi:heme-degrading monooxygenase HmoA